MTISITLMQSRVKNLLTDILLIGFALATTSASASDQFQDRRPLRNLRDIKHIIIIYQENWSFDALYGQFPGADGYANSFDTLPQFDVKADPPYSALNYQTPSPLTGFPLAPDPLFPSVDGKLGLGSNPELALPLIPYDLTKYIKPDGTSNDELFSVKAAGAQSGHDGTEGSFARRAKVFEDVASGKLPPVVFIAMPIWSPARSMSRLVAAVQKSKIWQDCVIIITYDENGGRWDHVVPPVREDGWGVGVRVPTIIVSPFVQRGAIHSTEYETVSILKLISPRFLCAIAIRR